MFIKKKNTLKISINSLLIAFIIYYLLKDVDLLGFFADDGTTLYILLKDISFNELITHSINWDAARDLHLIWQKFFIIISFSNKISNLHYYQIFFYLINASIFCYILRKLEFNYDIILIIFISSIFFPSYSEVAFWIHAFTMILISTFFFLIFVLLQINILNINNIKKELILNFFSVILLLLTWFTYEQSIFVSLLVVIIINFIKLKKKNIPKKFFLFQIFIYSLLVIFFSLYKLYDAGFFDSSFTKYQTGSNIIFDYQVFKNILISFAINLREFFVFNKFLLRNLDVIELIIFNILFIFFIYFILTDKKKLKFNYKFDYKVIIIFLTLFIASIFPLYFHYISDRHNYLPSFFMFAGISYLIKFFISKNRHLFSNIIFIFLTFYFINNFVIKFNFKKYQIIENFNIKLAFYKALDNNPQIVNFKEKIFLKDFPELRNGEVFFAHEPSVNFKLIMNNESLPYISIEDNYIIGDTIIQFNEINKGIIDYEIYKY